MNFTCCFSKRAVNLVRTFQRSYARTGRRRPVFDVKYSEKLPAVDSIIEGLWPYEKNLVIPQEVMGEGKYVRTEVKEKNPTNSKVLDIFSSYIERSLDHLSPEDPRFGKSIIEARSSSVSNAWVILECKRTIVDALYNGAKLHMLYTSDRALLKGLPNLCPEAGIHYVKYRDIQQWSNTTTSPGLLAIFHRPSVEDIQSHRQKQPTLPLIVVCDKIHHEEVMAALIRTAAAFNVDKVLVTKDCVNVWSDKVVRSAVGAHFTLPCISGIPSLKDTVTYFPQPCRIFAVSSPATEESHSMHSVQFMTNPSQGEKCVLLLTGEVPNSSNGLSQFVHQSFGCFVHLPVGSEFAPSLPLSLTAGAMLSQIYRQCNIST